MSDRHYHTRDQVTEERFFLGRLQRFYRCDCGHDIGWRYVRGTS